MNPRVSIIIPTYNYGHFLNDALDSIRRQTFPDWECLVVDDGSTDDTAAVVQRASGEDSRFTLISQANQGQSAARNTGISHARGQYIQFLDSDDMLQPDKLNAQVAYLDNHPETGIVYGKSRYFETGKEDKLFFDRWGDPSKEWMPMLSGKGTPMIRAFAEMNILDMGCALFRRGVIEKAGRFDSGVLGTEDYLYCFRAAVTGSSWHYLEAPSTSMLVRHHPGSFSKDLANSYRKELETRLHMRDILKDIGDKGSSAVNDDRYAWRMRRLQNLFIDQTIKSGGKTPRKKDLQWIFHHSSLKQNLYFFPRIVKAVLLNGGRLPLKT